MTNLRINWYQPYIRLVKKHCQKQFSSMFFRKKVNYKLKQLIHKKKTNKVKSTAKTSELLFLTVCPIYLNYFIKTPDNQNDFKGDFPYFKNMSG